MLEILARETVRAENFLSLSMSYLGRKHRSYLNLKPARLTLNLDTKWCWNSFMPYSLKQFQSNDDPAVVNSENLKLEEK